MSNPTREGEESLFTSAAPVRWHSRILPVLLACGLVGFYYLTPADVASSWALSRSALEDSTWPLTLYQLAHGGTAHVALNAAALAFLGPTLIARLGSPPASWGRFFYILIGSGISGGLLFVILNADPRSSAIGASGAIFGIVGALARVNPGTGHVVPLVSRRCWLLVKMFFRDHAIMFGLIFLVLALTGSTAMIAWQAHLGGMLFGLLVVPAFLPKSGEP